MNVANARTLAPGLSVRFLSARYPDHCSARCRLEANLDDVASGYACLCGLGQLGNCVSFYMIPSVERQRQWIMHRIGQREWIMHSMYPLVGVGLSSHRAAQGRRATRQLFRFADEDCPVRSGRADARAGLDATRVPISLIWPIVYLCDPESQFVKQRELQKYVSKHTKLKQS